MSAQASSVAVQQSRRFRQRHLWLIPGLAVAIYASTLGGHLGLGLVPLLVFGVVPHLSVLLALGQPHVRGQLAPRAVPIFNAMHHPAPPLVMVGIAAAGVLSPFWLVGGLARAHRSRLGTRRRAPIRGRIRARLVRAGHRHRLIRGAVREARRLNDLLEIATRGALIGAGGAALMVA